MLLPSTEYCTVALGVPEIVTVPDVPSQIVPPEIEAVGSGITFIVAHSFVNVCVQSSVDVTSTKQYIEFDVKLGDVTVVLPVIASKIDVCCMPLSIV